MSTAFSMTIGAALVAVGYFAPHPQEVISTIFVPPAISVDVPCIMKRTAATSTTVDTTIVTGCDFGRVKEGPWEKWK